MLSILTYQMGVMDLTEQFASALTIYLYTDRAILKNYILSPNLSFERDAYWRP
jgi:hypothetical protein